MHTIERMIVTHPIRSHHVQNELVELIESCFECAQACNACADACLGELVVERLRRCIRLNLDCADICVVTGRIVSRVGSTNDAVVDQLVRACGVACRVCMEECDYHANMHEHCRVCAEACRHCLDACEHFLAGEAALQREV
jgi:hypothetical protein